MFLVDVNGFMYSRKNKNVNKFPVM